MFPTPSLARIADLRTATIRFVLLLALLFSAAVPALAEDETEVRALLERWAASYSAADATPEGMLAHYDADSVFWGTGGQTPFVGAAQIGPYFGQQFSNFPQRRVSFIDPLIRIYGDTATATGLYRFEVRTRGGDALDVTHRFSFALSKTDSGWRLVHQHSSAMPR